MPLVYLHWIALVNFLNGLFSTWLASHWSKLYSVLPKMYGVSVHYCKHEQWKSSAINVNMSTLFKQTNCWEQIPAQNPKKLTNKSFYNLEAHTLLGTVTQLLIPACVHLYMDKPLVCLLWTHRRWSKSTPILTSEIPCKITRLNRIDQSEGSKLSKTTKHTHTTDKSTLWQCPALWKCLEWNKNA